MLLRTSLGRHFRSASLKGTGVYSQGNSSRGVGFPTFFHGAGIHTNSGDDVSSGGDLLNENMDASGTLLSEAFTTGNLTEKVSEIAQSNGVAELVKSTADLGFWPSDLALKTLEFVHLTTDLPWWLTIVSTTIAMRTVILPIVVNGMKNSSIMTKIKPEMDSITARMSSASDMDEKLKIRAEIQELFKRNNCSPFKSLVGPLLQIPMFMGFFFGLKKMDEFFPDVHQGGAYWFTDLAASDPTYILPTVAAASMLITIEIGSSDMKIPNMPHAKNLMRLMSLIILPASTQLPQSVLVYWVASNTYSIFQSALFKIPFLKSRLGIETPPSNPIVTKNEASSSPFAKAMAAFSPKSETPKYSNIKDQRLYATRRRTKQ